VPLNSWQFLALSGTAALLIPAAPPAFRGPLFLVVNATFALSYWGLSTAPIAIAFCLAGYVCARLVAGRGAGALAVAVTALTVAFAVLRGYSLDGFRATSPPASGGVLAFAGLSFLFFKMTHVVVDTAAGTMAPPPFWHYVRYCTNFTTLLMGPIQRYQDFMSQWTAPAAGALDFEGRLDAMNRILRGLVKAFAAAPWLAPLVLRPGLPLETMSLLELLTRLYGFYVFLYLDFSGYCDIVIGVGTLMGVRPPENFRFPFAARNVSEYWLRVHRSLTQWLTDYVFTPTYRALLGQELFARHALLALSLSLLVTMTVAGLWHGTTLNFLAFGVVHGLALVVLRAYEHVMQRWLGRQRFRAFSASWPVTAAAVFLTWNLTSMAYAFFVLDLRDSLRLFGRLAGVVGAGA
jgi:D-alanyl-lipoteichoic acid acyltransferase DltB (MBOAT superfamily)